MRYRRDNLAHGEGSRCPRKKSQDPGNRTFQFSWDFGARGCPIMGTRGIGPGRGCFVPRRVLDEGKPGKDMAKTPGNNGAT